MPADNGQPCYIITAVATGNGTTANITTWSDPVLFAKDSPYVILTNDNHGFQVGNDGSIDSSVARTTTGVLAYIGSTLVPCSVDVSAITKPTGMTITSNNSTTAGGLVLTISLDNTTTSEGGVVNIPVTLTGYGITINKGFS